MPEFSICVPHKIGRQAALVRVQRFLNEIGHDHAHRISNIHREWHNNRLEFTFTARGVQIQGTLVVEEETVHVSGPAQLPVILFRSQIEEAIRRELETLLQ
jgi:hypothetical protein